MEKLSDQVTYQASDHRLMYRPSKLSTSSSTCLVFGNFPSFSVLGSSIVTSTGAIVVCGDLELFPESSVTGFPLAILNGNLYITDSTAINAQHYTTYCKTILVNMF